MSDLIQEIINSSVWAASSIEDTPHIELGGWKIYEVSSEYWPEVTRHFSGYNLTEHEGRCSSAIVEFDKEKMTGRTSSGRIYQLSDKRVTMGQMCDAAHVWAWFVGHNKLNNVKEITLEDLSK
jgi:hypothetical protein